MSRKAQLLIAVIAIAVGGALILTQLPTRGFDRDITQVGQGQPTVVLGYENHSPVGIAAMGRVNHVREDYEDRILFLVADLMDEQGEAFAREHLIGDGYIGLFDGQGELLDRGEVPEEESALRGKIEGAFGSN